MCWRNTLAARPLWRITRKPGHAGLPQGALAVHGPHLLAVREAAHALKLELPHKRDQLCVLLGRLAREACMGKVVRESQGRSPSV